MATTQKLVTEFTGEDGKNVSYSFGNALPSDEITAMSVKSLMDGMITNKTLFEKRPSVKKSASLVVTNETEINISE